MIIRKRPGFRSTDSSIYLVNTATNDQAEKNQPSGQLKKSAFIHGRKILTRGILFVFVLIFCSCFNYLRGYNIGVSYTLIQAEIINKDNSPIEIMEYTASISHGDNPSYNNGLKLYNKSNKKIIRFDIQFKLYDVYGELLETLIGYSTKPIEGGNFLTTDWCFEENIENEGTFISLRRDVSTGHKTFASVSRLAFEDGTIWQADSN